MKHTKPRKTRRDVKLTAEKFQTIEAAFRHGMNQDSVAAITAVNAATVSTVHLVLEYLGRL